MLIFNCFATFVAVGLGFIGLVKLRTHSECLAVVINYVLQFTPTTAVGDNYYGTNIA